VVEEHASKEERGVKWKFKRKKRKEKEVDEIETGGTW
jgi:hypothetical protein